MHHFFSPFFAFLCICFGSLKGNANPTFSLDQLCDISNHKYWGEVQGKVRLDTCEAIAKGVKYRNSRTNTQDIKFQAWEQNMRRHWLCTKTPTLHTDTNLYDKRKNKKKGRRKTIKQMLKSPGADFSSLNSGLRVEGVWWGNAGLCPAL